MSRKRKAPKKIPIVDPKYKSVIIPKLINSIMLDGKKTIAIVFLPSNIIELINFGIITDLYLGSTIGIFLGAFLFRDIFIYLFSFHIKNVSVFCLQLLEYLNYHEVYDISHQVSL